MKYRVICAALGCLVVCLLPALSFFLGGSVYYRSTDFKTWADGIVTWKFFTATSAALWLPLSLWLFKCWVDDEYSKIKGKKGNGRARFSG